MLKIAFDIGGVLSKYPHEFRQLSMDLQNSGNTIYIITNMHNKNEIVNILNENGFAFIPIDNIYCADYTTHGEFCKAVLMKELSIDILIDDFVGYTQWDSKLGSAPIRLLVIPDGFQPYWHKDWKVKDIFNFGRRQFNA